MIMVERFAVTVNSFDEHWTHSTHDDLRDAESTRRMLESHMPGAIIKVQLREEPMSYLSFKWGQIRSIKEQIEAAEGGHKFGRTGKITTAGETVVSWDDWSVSLEIPDDDSDEDASER